MVGNPEDAADIMQETFVNAWRSWGKFRGDSLVFTWLYQIAYNNVKNWYKVRDRRRGRESFSLDSPIGTDDEDGMARDVADWSALPERLFLDKELDTLVRDAVEALSPEYRDVFVLSVWENMSYEEVAQVSGLTVPAVKTRLHRARLKIKLRLDPYIAGLGKQDK
jgi:RNA polymerase sigma-70 factor (ECF subfamily)